MHKNGSKDRGGKRKGTETTNKIRHTGGIDERVQRKSATKRHGSCDRLSEAVRTRRTDKREITAGQICGFGQPDLGGGSAAAAAWCAAASVWKSCEASICKWKMHFSPKSRPKLDRQGSHGLGERHGQRDGEEGLLGAARRQLQQRAARQQLLPAPLLARRLLRRAAHRVA